MGFMTHVTCKLTAKNRDQLRNPMIGSRVWASFTFLLVTRQVAARGRGGGVCGVSECGLLLDQWSGTSGILLRAFFIGFILFIDRLFYSLLDILSRHSHIDFRQKGSFSSRFYLFRFIDFISFIYFTLPAYLSGRALVWLSVWSEVLTCICPS